MVERNLAKVEVAGSIPVIRSRSSRSTPGASLVFSPVHPSGLRSSTFRVRLFPTSNAWAAPIPDELVHHVLIGAAAQPYVSSSESELPLGLAQLGPSLIDAHAEGLVTTLLPGLKRQV